VANVRGTRGATRQSTQLTILVVDDEPKIARTVVHMLSEHRVHGAASGFEALDACKRLQPDLIFCDLMMPEMSGADLLTALQELGGGLQDRVVFMTGGVPSAMSGVDVPELPPTPNSVLSKPFTLEQLTHIIDEFVTKKARAAARSARGRRRLN
jgi:CheY-like chemotaxis protein